ncbi:MAG: branched-chain amino acid ABC transporter permease, partial [Thermocrispum sp.]
MTELLTTAFLSIPLIGAFVLFTIGVVAIYRASRVLNLAHGAMAVAPAYVEYALVQAGLHPLTALPLAVASGVLLGIGVERLFVRRLRPQGPTAQTVGTVAVTGVIIAVVAKLFGTTSLPAPTIFPDGEVRVGDVATGYSELGLLAVGLVVAALTFAFFRFTGYGLAMRGAAVNREAAGLMGIDAD